MTNAKFAETNSEFRAACEEVATINLFRYVRSTKRQASRWRMRKGAAWKNAQFLMRKT